MRRACVFCVLLPLAFAQDPKKDPDQIGTRDVSKGVNFYSVEKEMALGKAMSEQIERSGKLFTDKQINEYVDRIVQKLVRNSDAKIPITVKILEGDDPNAVTVPGGHIYLWLGLLRTADTEAELAAALAHEIAHVAARHGTREATRSEIGQIATIPLIFMPGWGACAGLISETAMPVGYFAKMRADESEADLLGVQYLYKAGYDPVEMVDIFEKIFSFGETKHHKTLAVLASTHPASSNRIVAVQKNIAELLKEQPQYVVNTSEFDNVKAHLAALDWIPKPPPEDDKRPSLFRKPASQVAEAKKLVPGSNPGASQLKEAYTVR